MWEEAGMRRVHDRGGFPTDEPIDRLLIDIYQH
jgi:hypothetical protein